MKRKILSLILVFAMTVSLLTVGIGAVEPTYGDTAGHWAESSIERWSGHGIIQGSNGLFDPNGQLTCAQLATILAKLLKLPAAKDAGFTDNTADAWYYDAINRCAAAGILNGNGDGTVTPEAPITRERAMVMLARALGIEPIRKPDLTKYTDAAQVSAYARGYVAALIEAGIVGGVTADELAPQANINRASTVTILDRAIGVYADKDGMTVNAKDGELVLVVAKNVKVINAPEGTKIVVADGATGLTVNGKSVSDDQTYIVPKTTSSGSSSGGYSHTHSYDATTHKCSCGEFAPDVVATIGDTNGYLTLKAAVAAATNGATVKLVKGALLDADISISSKITLDLNGNTIETNGKKISVAGTGDLTVTGNGIVNNQVDADKAGGTTNRYTMLSVEEGGKLTIENGTFTTKAAQIVYTYGSTTIRGGTFKNTSTNTSKETVDALNSGALIVVCGTPASLTMTDGTVTTESQYLYGVFVRDGANAIFGDEETKNGPSIHTHRYAAIGENNTMATANITIYGGEYTVSTVPASDEWKPFCATIYASASGEINIHGGTFTGYYAISDRYEKVEQTVTITGGTFNGAEADLYVTSESSKGTTANRIIAIAGGTFGHKPDATYIATGYVAKNNNNGTWTVSEKTNVTLVAQVGVNKYETLADALAAAKNGDIVTLTQDITPDERIVVTGNKNITIDLAEKKITSKADVAIVNNGTGKLTITGNGTVDTSSSTNDENIAIWARTGSIDIENGTFINKSNKEATVYVGTSASANEPVITIKGGTFKNSADGAYTYNSNLNPLTLNVQNDKSVTSIVITGGTFVGQNPGDGDDNKGGTFLAEGYEAVENEGKWTVKPIFAGGTGTAEDPFVIQNAEQLKAFRDKVNAGNTFEGKTIKLMADINLEDEEWTPIGTSTNPFKGVFDGNDKTISNYKIIAADSNGSGLFGVIAGNENSNFTQLSDVVSEDGTFSTANISEDKYTCVVKNLNVSSATVTGGAGTEYVSPVIGAASNAYIANINVTNTNMTVYKYGAGIVAKLDKGVVNNCTTGGTFTGSGTGAGGHIAGIVAKVSGNAPFVVMDCTNNANITAQYGFNAGICGNIVAANSLIVYNCTNNGAISGTGANIIAGVVAHSQGGYYIDCNNTGALSGTITDTEKGFGGIAGYITNYSHFFYNCTNTGDMSGATAAYVAGICGRARQTTTLYNCKNSGALPTSESSVAQIVNLTDDQQLYMTITGEMTTEQMIAEINKVSGGKKAVTFAGTLSDAGTLTLPAGCESFTSATQTFSNVSLANYNAAVALNIPGEYTLTGLGESKTVTIGGTNVYVTVPDTEIHGGSIKLSGDNMTLANNGTLNHVTFTGEANSTYTLNNNGTITCTTDEGNQHTVDSVSAARNITIHNRGTIESKNNNGGTGSYAMLFYGGCTVAIHDYPGSVISAGERSATYKFVGNGSTVSYYLHTAGEANDPDPIDMSNKYGSDLPSRS